MIASQFDLPALFIDHRDHRRLPLHIVGQEFIFIARCAVQNMHKPEFLPPISFCALPGQCNDLILKNTTLKHRITLIALYHAVFHVYFAPRDEETPTAVQNIHPFKIDITPVHDNNAVLGERKAVRFLTLMYLAIGNLHENRQAAIIVKNGMQFRCTLIATEFSPVKYRQA